MTARAIVCGIDDSHHARAAARAAAALAQRLRLRLVVVHAVTAAARPVGAPRVPDLAWKLDEAHDAGERLLADVSRDLGGTVATRICSGAAAPCLASVARDEQAMLVVIGSRGTRAIRAVFAGAVTDELVRRSPCPLMIVPPLLAETYGGGVTGDHVLCGIQNSEDLRCAQLAQWLAGGLGLRLKLAHVVPRSPDVAAITPAGVLPLNVPARGHTLERDAERRLRRLAERLGGGTDADLSVTRGDAARELTELAAAGDAALVVVGTRRWRGSVRAAVLGSVARHLACEGSSPVIVCPSDRPAGPSHGHARDERRRSRHQ